MNYLQETFLNSVKNCCEDTLSMSKKSCHQVGLDSIVIRKNPDGSLVRAFFAHENHSMWENSPENPQPSLGYHDHKYDLVLTELYGESYNVNSEINLAAGELNLLRFKSMLDGYERSEIVSSHIAVNCEMEKIGRIFLPYDQLHTVYVPKGKKAAWLVEEGIVKQHTTNLITHLKPEDITDKILYQSFGSKDDIIEMVEEFFN